MIIDCGKLLYEQIVEDITGRIRTGTLAVGDRLESVQALRQEYGVSHITILRVLRELTGNGVIRKNGRRYQVAGASLLPEESTLGARNSTLGLFIRPFRESSLDDYFNEINLAVEREISMARMNYLRSHYTMVFNFSLPDESGEYDQSGEMLRQMLAMAQRVCGMLIDERVPERVLKAFLAQSPVPVVLVNRATEASVSCVTPPSKRSVELLLDKALQLGYREVFFCGSDHRRYFNDFARYQALRAAAELPQYRELAFHWHTDIKRPIHQYIEAVKLDMTAGQRPLLLASSDAFAMELLTQIETEQFRAGRDFGVCGFYAIKALLPDGRRLSTVKVNTAAIGAHAVKLLLNRIQYPWNSGNEEFQVPIEFIYGDTL